MARQGIVKLKDRREARRAGVSPWRTRRTGAAPAAQAAFTPREQPKHEASKAQMSIRRIRPITAPDGAFDEHGRPNFSIEDIRDDTISVIRNSDLTFEEIRAKGGPTPATLTKWLERTTQRPQLNTIASALDACGFQFVVQRKKK